VWDKLSLDRLKWVALFIVLAVAAAFGGLDAVDRVTPVAMGQTYDDGPLRITARSAALPPAVDGLASLDEQCRFLTVDVTIESATDRSVTLPSALPIVGTPVDCTGSRPLTISNTFGIHGIPAYFKGAVRRHDGQTMPSVEPGFTTDYRLVWAVPAADLTQRPQISLRMPVMTEFISTFRIAEGWGGDADAYGNLDLAPAVYE
jgi:hypothetical protein